MKNSIKTYRCHKDSNIKQGDLVHIDKDGYVKGVVERLKGEDKKKPDPYDIVKLMENIKRSYWDAVMVEHKVNHVYRLPKQVYQETCKKLSLMADVILDGAGSKQEWERFCMKNHGLCLECRKWIEGQLNRNMPNQVWIRERYTGS